MILSKHYKYYPVIDFLPFSFSPIKKKCSYCNVEVVTYVEHEGHPLFVIGAFFVILIFGFLSLIILPIAYMVTKNAVHRCSRCLQKLGEKQCFGVPTNFKDEVSFISSDNNIDLANQTR